MAIVATRLKLSKGHQFTLPAASMRQHKLKPGQEMDFVDTGDELIMKPVKKHSLKEIIGKYKLGRKFDAVKEHNEIL